MFFSTAMFNSHAPDLSEDASVVSSSSGARVHQDLSGLNHVISSSNVSLHNQNPQKIKKKRSLPGNPDPDAEVIALSPKTLVATNRYVCEICHKGFQREQNLQLHRRGHNLPWKLKQRSSNKEVVVVKKKAYVCPEPSCVHHNPSRALGDLTGIKKHYCRKHGEKKWKCDKCSKLYAVQSDWKAHSKICGTREYKCDCGTIFSRKDSFITHRAFCDALAEETERLSATQIAAATAAASNPLLLHSLFHFPTTHRPNFQNHFLPWNSSSSHNQNPNPNPSILHNFHIKPEPQTFLHHDPTATFSSHPLTLLQQLQNHNEQRSRLHVASPSAATSATALLQIAATVGATISSTGLSASSSLLQQQQSVLSHVGELGRASQQQQLEAVMGVSMTRDQHQNHLTRDFLGLTEADAANMKDMLTFTGGTVEYQQQLQRFGFFGINSSSSTTASETWRN